MAFHATTGTTNTATATAAALAAATHGFSACSPILVLKPCHTATALWT